MSINSINSFVLLIILNYIFSLKSFPKIKSTQGEVRIIKNVNNNTDIEVTDLTVSPNPVKLLTKLEVKIDFKAKKELLFEKLFIFIVYNRIGLKTYIIDINLKMIQNDLSSQEYSYNIPSFLAKGSYMVYFQGVNNSEEIVLCRSYFEFDW